MEQSPISRVPDRKGGESQGEQEPHLGERKGDQSESNGEERMDSTVKEGRFQEEEEKKAKRVSLGEVEENMSG